MTRMQALLQEQATLRNELRDISNRIDSENRARTDEEAARSSELVARLQALGGEDGNGGEIAAERAIRDQLRNQASEPDPMETPAPRIALGNGNAQGAQVFASFGEQLKAIALAAQGDFGARNQLIQAAALGAGEAVSEDGGFLVQPDFTSAIERIMHDQGAVLGRLVPVEVGGNGLVLRFIDETSRATGSRNGAVQGYWVDEGTAPTASQLKFRRIELKLHKVAALGYATEELLEDVPALGQELQTAFADELLFLVEDSIINGNGVGAPKGIMNEAAMISVAKETGQAATTIVYENLLKMWARMHVRSRAQAAWFYTQDAEPQLWQLYLAAGTGALPANFISYTPDGQLRIFGRPAIAIEYCATLGTTGDIILADMREYKFITKAGGVRQASSMHVRFTTDEMAFRATYRVDGQSKWSSALTPFKGTATVSPFVKLDTRA